MMVQRSFFPSLLLVASASASLAAGASPQQLEFFEKQVRPLLAEHCVDCHGAKRHENGLRLDDASAVTRGSEYGPVVQPGNPAASKLFKAVNHIAGVEPMPKKAAKLNPAQIADLERWIREGAVWPESKAAPAAEAWRSHWAFLPVTRPAVPQVASQAPAAQPKNPVDAFVLSKLSAAGLSLAEPADSLTLCRRLYLAVTGLQPTWEQLTAFEAAAARGRDTAVRGLVEDLLASPHYGERWGRYWLDIARYSDTEGYQVAAKDIRYPYAYTYRDWVIAALNGDLPYDQFLSYQLAADRLVKPEDSRHLAALGFLTVGDTFIGNTDLQTDDRIDVTCRGMLGLTVGCARCHNHKYDPIPTKDYYAMYSIFRSSEIPAELPLIGGSAPTTERSAFDTAAAAVRAKMDALREEIWKADRSMDSVKNHLALAQQGIEQQLSDSAFKGLAGKLKLRNRIADTWRDMIEKKALKTAKADPVMLAWKEFAALPAKDFAAKAPEVVKRLDAAGAALNSVFRHELTHRPAPKSMADIIALYADILVNSLSGIGKDNAEWNAVRAFVAQPFCPLSIPVASIENFFTRADADRMVKLRNELKKLELEMPGAPARAMVMVDRSKPVDVHVMIRGNPGRPGERAPRANLSLLGGQLFADGSGRLELARSITSRDNPLTARVLVNRVWMQLFGKPLVVNPSDFGVQTPKPEQAELLDYLAATFMDEGWSVKSLQRLILTSAAYQQSSESTAAKDLKDPENNLISHFNRQRLDYEAMRDAIAQATGALDSAHLGGRSIPQARAEADSRRSVYHLVDRYDQATVPAMFDFANPDLHSSQRSLTTVPQQALFLMNSPFMAKQSRTLTKTLLKPQEAKAPRTSQADAELLQTLYRRVLLREPSVAELDLAQRFLADATVLGKGTHLTKWTYGAATLKQDGASKAVTLTDFQQAKNLIARGSWKVMVNGATMPSKEWHHLFWSTNGGHPGPGDMAAVARWEVPYDREIIRIKGKATRSSDQGNAAHAWILNSRTGRVADRVIQPKGSVEMSAEMEVKRGDQVIFAITCEGDTNSDSVSWVPEVYRYDPAKQKAELITKTERDFCGPDGWPLNRDRPQSALAQLAQVLLMSNEFMFVD